jgi:hypothetical protein
VTAVICGRDRPTTVEVGGHAALPEPTARFAAASATRASAVLPRVRGLGEHHTWAWIAACTPAATFACQVSVARVFICSICAGDRPSFSCAVSQSSRPACVQLHSRQRPARCVGVPASRHIVSMPRASGSHSPVTEPEHEPLHRLPRVTEPDLLPLRLLDQPRLTRTLTLSRRRVLRVQTEVLDRHPRDTRREPRVQVHDRLEVRHVGRVELERLRVRVRHRPHAPKYASHAGQRLPVRVDEVALRRPQHAACGTAWVSCASCAFVIARDAESAIGITSHISDTPSTTRPSAGSPGTGSRTAPPAARPRLWKSGSYSSCPARPSRISHRVTFGRYRVARVSCGTIVRRPIQPQSGRHLPCVRGIPRRDTSASATRPSQTGDPVVRVRPHAHVRPAEGERVVCANVCRSSRLLYCQFSHRYESAAAPASGTPHIEALLDPIDRDPRPVQRAAR